MATTILAAAVEFCTRNRFPGSGPTDITGQVSQYQRAVSAVVKAHKEIVTAHPDWDFMWKQGTVSLQSGGNPHTASAASADFPIRHYDTETFYLNSDGSPISFIPWEHYRENKLTPTEQAATDQPTSVTIQPDNKIIGLPYPDANGPYQVNFDYWAGAITFDDKNDNLQIPDDGLEALYDRARMIFLDDEEAPNYVLAEKDFTANFALLEQNYWPGSDTARKANNQDVVVNAGWDDD